MTCVRVSTHLLLLYRSGDILPPDPRVGLLGVHFPWGASDDVAKATKDFTPDVLVDKHGTFTRKEVSLDGDN